MKKSNRVLAIDIGNTTISYGLFSNARLIAYGYVEGSHISFLIKSLTRYEMNRQYTAVISSVVPKMTRKIEKLLKSKYKIRSLFVVGRNLKVKMKMAYQPKALGTDRLINIYGAVQKYKTPLVVIGCGTAITIDYVSSSGKFEGGLIVPGVKTSLDALHEKTALLPKISSIKPVKMFIGRDTKSAMMAGVLYGLGSLIDGLISKFQKKSEAKLTTLMTGGFSLLLKPYVRKVDRVDPQHTLKSIFQILSSK